MKNQTAVEWLVSILNKQGFAPVLTDEEIQQANKMFEQQIMDAHNQGYADGYRDNGNGSIDYFNETFNK